MVLELTIGGPAYYHNHFCCCTCGGNDHENFCCFVSDVTCEGPKSEPWLLLTCDGHVVSFISFSSSKLCTHAEKNNNSSYLFLSIVMFRKWGDVLKRSHVLDTRAHPPTQFLGSGQKYEKKHTVHIFLPVVLMMNAKLSWILLALLFICFLGNVSKSFDVIF